MEPGLIESVLSVVRFFNPWYKKPIIEFEYLSEYPYVIINKDDLIFYRFSIKNIGKSVAENCLCEIKSLEKDNKIYGHFIGFPLKWAGQDLIGNKLSLSRGEVKYIDLVMGVKNKTELNFLSNNNAESAVDNKIEETGKYSIELLFVGDNFDKKTLKFTVLLSDDHFSNDYINIKFHQPTWWEIFKNKNL